MPAPLVAAAGFGIWKAFTWIGIAIAGAYATKKVTEAWGSTPINDAQQIPGMNKITPKELYYEAKQHKKDRQKYLKKKTKKYQDKIDKLNEQIEKKEEEVTKLNKQAREENDPVKKAQLFAAVEDVKKDIANLKKERGKEEGEKKEVETAIDDIFKDAGDLDKLGQEGYVANAGSINWRSYRNYGIIFLCIIVIIMIIGAVKKLLNSLMDSMR